MILKYLKGYTRYYERQKTPLPSISTRLGGIRVSKGPLKAN
jgi:hypothetical protein